MTRQERLKLAKAARELASEFAEGRGPYLRSGDWCGCASGQVFKRAGVSNSPDRNYFVMPAKDLDGRLDGVLTEATDRERGCYGDGSEPLPGAVVFALLWAADELESAP